MKKKVAKVVIVAAVLLSVTKPASAFSVCDLDPTTLEIWLAQQLFCHN